MKPKKLILILFAIAALLGTLSACGGSKEEKKALATIKKYLINDHELRLKAKNYLPSETTIDSCFFAAIEDEQSLVLSKQLIEVYRAIQDPNAEMKELLKAEQPDMERMVALTSKLEGLHDDFVEREDLLIQRIREVPPAFVGWIVRHKFVHKIEGAFEEVSMEFVLDKEFKKVLYPDRFDENGEILGDPSSFILLLSFENEDDITVVSASPDDEDVLSEEENPERAYS